ncbi:hypothetical protein Ahy_A07g033742 [Arachis hypogaea]|uniref:Transposase MuDR plant domain-containing protein n=1 Tax=Arachis hypogaea TaxID=3818 RepID=A0A445CAC6_ARAHY|nr:hypothetical protein Ahy_A07g033742 [Arachis hypogaea]
MDSNLCAQDSTVSSMLNLGKAKFSVDLNISSGPRKTKVTTTTRVGRHVKTLEVEEDSDSHDSYESAEESLYKPPKVLGDDEYSSDSDDGVNSTRVNKKSEVKEKHKPAKTKLAEKEIETDDSSYEASEDEDDCDSDLEDNNVDEGDSDLNSWHSKDSGQELDSDEESPIVYPQYNDKAKFRDLKFEVSMIFKSKEHFMQATRDYTIQLGRNILFTKNDKVRVRAVCKAEGCPWVVYCARSKQDGSWQIKTLVDNHICPRRRKNRAATQHYLVTELPNSVGIIKRNCLKFMAGPQTWWWTWESTLAVVGSGNSQPKPSRPTKKRRKDKGEQPVLGQAPR